MCIHDHLLFDLAILQLLYGLLFFEVLVDLFLIHFLLGDLAELLPYWWLEGIELSVFNYVLLSLHGFLLCLLFTLHDKVHLRLVFD